jgi:hypothetical protein
MFYKTLYTHKENDIKLQAHVRLLTSHVFQLLLAQKCDHIFATHNNKIMVLYTNHTNGFRGAKVHIQQSNQSLYCGRVTE